MRLYQDSGHVLNLPLLQYDETLFSLLSRTMLLSSQATSTDLSRLLLGNRRAALIFDYPHGLSTLARLMPPPLSSPVDIAIAATCLPFFVRFREPKFAQSAVEQICSGTVASLKRRLGLQACAVGASLPIKACPECMEEDVGSAGAAYWHRTPQLPGVAVCPAHRVGLITAKSMRQGKQTTLFLPSDLTWTRSADTQNKSSSSTLQFAKLAAAALQCRLPGQFDQHVLYHTYRHALKERQLLSRSGRLRLAELESKLRLHVSSLPRGVQLCRPELSREIVSLVDILRSKRETSNTLPNLVLIGMLFGTWEHFISVYEWESTMSPTQQCETQPPSATYRPSSIQRRLISPSERHRRRQEAVTSVLRYLTEHPGASRSQIARDVGGPWRWLYRHDPDWLEKNCRKPLPPNRRYDTWVNWPQRDARLHALAMEQRDRISLSAGRRITVSTVLRELGPLPFAVQLAKMPRTAALLNDIVEEMRRQRM